jgi:hypothetical protein
LLEERLIVSVLRSPSKKSVIDKDILKYLSEGAQEMLEKLEKGKKLD